MRKRSETRPFLVSQARGGCASPVLTHREGGPGIKKFDIEQASPPTIGARSFETWEILHLCDSSKTRRMIVGQSCSLLRRQLRGYWALFFGGERGCDEERTLFVVGCVGGFGGSAGAEGCRGCADTTAGEDGLWQNTATSTMAGIELLPDVAAKMQATGRSIPGTTATTTVTQSCLTPEKWQKSFENMQQNNMQENKDCQYERSPQLAGDVGRYGANDRGRSFKGPHRGQVCEPGDGQRKGARRLRKRGSRL